MKTVGVRELEEHISEMVRLVQETGETVAVTKDGEVIAHLAPPALPQGLDQVVSDSTWTSVDQLKAEIDAHRSKDVNDVAGEDIWASLDRLSAEISAHWPKDVSAVDAIREVRREL